MNECYLEYLKEIKNIVDYEIKFDKTNANNYMRQFINENTTNDVHLLDEALKQNKEVEFLHIYAKTNIKMMLKDFIENLETSFYALDKRRLSSGFTLSRKPIQDTLFYFEQLLIDHISFTRDLLQGKVISIEEKHKLLINKRNDVLSNIKKMNTTSFMNNEKIEQIYKIRFDNNYLGGLNFFWQKGNHLFTTRGDAYKTVRADMNFVFSMKEDEDVYLEAYYHNLYYMLEYSMFILLELTTKTFSIVRKNTSEFIEKVRKITKEHNEYLLKFDKANKIGIV